GHFPGLDWLRSTRSLFRKSPAKASRKLDQNALADILTKRVATKISLFVFLWQSVCLPFPSPRSHGDLRSPTHQNPNKTGIFCAKNIFLTIFGVGLNLSYPWCYDLTKNEN